MEVVHQQKQRRSSLDTCRETSPTKKMSAPTNNNNPKVVLSRPTFKKVQVVYYLSRNGHLEHPHYIEVSHLAHKPLRLKDFMDRLVVLRGKGMPSLYSWSCKRSYKNGYVWNDLAENDVIYPSEGVEYVLKGSELIDGCTEKSNQVQVGNHHHPKAKHLCSKPYQEDYQDQEQYVRKLTTIDTPYTTCSRGVSTDHEISHHQNKQNITSLDINPFSSPPESNTSSSSETNETATIDNHVRSTNDDNNNNNNKRLEDDDRALNDPMLSRSSMLFSLIACGGSTSFRKGAPQANDDVDERSMPPQVASRKSVSSSGINLHKGVVCKAAAATKIVDDDDEMMMIKYMSENPRFGNLHCEEKEYFSGSIVESMSNDQERPSCVEPGLLLQKSSSYNEERSNKDPELLEEVAKEETKKEKKGRCIPRMMMVSSTKQCKK